MDVLDDPYTMEYVVQTIVPNEIIRVDFRLGFRVEHRIQSMFRKVVEEMVHNKEVNIVSRYESLSKNNVMGDFNGRVFVSLFDKSQNLQTLGQDPTSYVRSFSVQRNILFKGSATVVNGLFKIKFNIPKDINYSFGEGKISYYAESGIVS